MPEQMVHWQRKDAFFLSLLPFFLLSLLLASVPLASSQLVGCIATNASLGIGYDLSVLRNATTNYKVVYVNQSSNSNYRYYLNICANLTAEPTPNPSNGTCSFANAGCQVDTNYTDQLPKNIGQFKTPPKVENGTITLLYTEGELCPAKSVNRSTSITFVCNETAGIGNPTFVQEDSSCRYYFSWQTVAACARHCTVNPCQNGGSCSEDKKNFALGYNCSCPVGFNGTNCQNNINDCVGNPCQHGTCIDGVNSYTCNCTGSGYSGTNCQTNINDCVGNSCLNGGQCVDGLNTYSCNCTGTGFNGSFCSENIDNCVDNACQNGATCNDGINQYTCNCGSTGFSGTLCENNIDDCTGNACQNGGLCKDGINAYTCDCSGTGFSGSYCTDNIDDCSATLCLNGGQCIDGVNSYSCDCSGTGFSGFNCSENIDDCGGNGCLNGGLCVDGINAYTCNCNNTGFSGTFCQQNINDCTPSSCRNGGTCIDGIQAFTCICPLIFLGSRCETAAPSPSIISLSPSVSPLLGTTVNVTASNFLPGFIAVMKGSAGFEVQLNLTSSVWRDDNLVSFSFGSPVYNFTGYVSIEFTIPGRVSLTYGDFFYTLDCPKEGQWGVGLDCRDCPRGAICPGGNRIWSKPGYWSPDETTAPQQCADPSTTRCPGGKLPTCGAGYEGVLCLDCAPNYYSQGDLCLSCQSRSPADTFARLIVDVIFNILLAISFLFLKGYFVRRLVIIFAALQVVRTALQVLEANLPEQLLDVTSVFAILSGDLTNFVRPGCVVNSKSVFLPFWINLGMVAGAQVIIAILLPIKYYVVEVKGLGRRKSDVLSVDNSQTSLNNILSEPPKDSPKDSPRMSKMPTESPLEIKSPKDAESTSSSSSEAEKTSRWIYMKNHLFSSWGRASIILFLFSYSTMAIRTFEVLICTNTFGEYVLALNANQPCFDSAHAPAFAIGIIVLIFYIIGLPVFLLTITFRLHQHGLLQNPRSIRTYGYIYDSFDSKSYFAGVFWVFVLLFQGIASAISFASLASMLVSNLVYIAYVAFVAIRRPFLREAINYFTIALVTFVVIIHLFAFFDVSEKAYIITGIVFFGLCLLMLVPLVILPAVTYLHNIYQLKYKSHLRGKLDSRLSISTTASSGTTKLGETLVISDMRIGTRFQKRQLGKETSVEMALFSPASS